MGAILYHQSCGNGVREGQDGFFHPLHSMSWDQKIDLFKQEVERLRYKGPLSNGSKAMIKNLFSGIDPESLAQNLSSLDHGCDEKSGVVVSLTSYPQRVHAGVTLATLVSLLRSTVKPYAIVLYLSKEEFPEQVIGGPYAKAYRGRCFAFLLCVLHPKKCHPGCGTAILPMPGLCYFFIFKTSIKAFWGTSTLPNWRMRFLPAFCFSSNLRLREISPP